MKKEWPEKLSDVPKVTDQVMAEPLVDARCVCKCRALQAPRCQRVFPKNASNPGSLHESCSESIHPGVDVLQRNNSVLPLCSVPSSCSPHSKEPQPQELLSEKNGGGRKHQDCTSIIHFSILGLGSCINSAAPQWGFFTP